MSVRKSPRPLPRPVPTKPAPAARMFRPSVQGWYAEWKAAREAPQPEAPPADQTPPPDEASEAVARWLTS